MNDESLREIHSSIVLLASVIQKQAECISAMNTRIETIGATIVRLSDKVDISNRRISDDLKTLNSLEALSRDHLSNELAMINAKLGLMLSRNTAYPSAYPQPS